MALIKSITFPSGVVVPAAYFLIDRIGYAKLDLSLSFHVIGYKDEDARNGFGVALQGFADAIAQVSTADLALSALRPLDTDTLEVVKRKEAASTVARDALNAASAAQNAAQSAAQSIKPLECGTLAFQVPHADLPSVLTNGQPDLAKLYVWLKAQPGWTDATDA
jgi:hypothetical protein